jgi:hypothetical protein
MQRTPSNLARWIGAGAALLLAAGALTAATSDRVGDSDSSSGLVARAPRDAAAREMQAASASGAGGGSESAVIADTAAAAASGAGQGIAPAGPRIVKRAEVRVEVEKDAFRSAFARVTALASSHGGFVASSTSHTDEDGDDERLAGGTLVLRVPVASFDTVRAALAELGDVKADTVSGEDVTGRLVDLDARIRSLQVEEDALRALMARARTMGETIEVQQQLTRVRQQIEQLQGQKAQLDDAASLATLHVDLFEPGVAAERGGDPNRLAESFGAAVDGSLAVIGGTVVVIGYLLPLGLLALLAWALWRLATRRHRTRLAV